MRSLSLPLMVDFEATFALLRLQKGGLHRVSMLLNNRLSNAILFALIAQEGVVVGQRAPPVLRGVHLTHRTRTGRVLVEVHRICDQIVHYAIETLLDEKLWIACIGNEVGERVTHGSRR